MKTSTGAVVANALDGSAAHRAMIAEQWVTHRLAGVRQAAEVAGLSKFEFARAVLHYGVEEMLWIGRDADLVDAAVAEATFLAVVLDQ